MTTAQDLRPKEWSEFEGQEELKARLEIHIQASIERGERLDHVFLWAPPGSGKTTLAALIASRLRTDFLSRVAPVKPALFRSLLREFHGVMLLDELHRMSTKEQEAILNLLTDGVYETDFGNIENQYLTIIGATTEPGKVIPPLRERFPIMPHFAKYTDEEMSRIVQHMARRVDLPVSDENAMALGRATNGIPRSAEKFIIAGRDLGTDDAPTILKFLKYTPEGLSIEHRQYLELLCKNEMMGLDAIVTCLDLPRAVIKEIERVLLDQGLLQYSKTGRIATQAAHKQVKEYDHA